MRFFIILILIITSLKVLSKSDTLPDPIIKGSSKYINTSKTKDQILYDSFSQLLNSYIDVENKMLTILNNDTLNIIQLRMLAIDFVPYFSKTLENKLNLFTKLIYRNFLLFPAYTSDFYGIDPKPITIQDGNYFDKLLSDYIINSGVLKDCDFFDQLRYDSSEIRKFTDENKFLEMKKSNRYSNIYYLSSMMRINREKLIMKKEEMNYNECFQKNSQLLLDAMDNKLSK